MIYNSAKIKRTIVIHIEKGEDLLESIREVITKEGIKSGLVLSGYGTLDRCRYHYITTNLLPPTDEFDTYEGPLELVGMDGVIASGEPHIHFDVANSEQSFGGHLEPGCRSLYLCDVVIAELEEIDMTFEVDPKTKLRGLKMQPNINEKGPAVEPDAYGNYRVVGKARGWDFD